MKKLTAAFGLILTLAACSTEPMPPAHVSHTLPPKINLDVQTVTLADRTSLQPGNSPYTNNHFTPTINDAIRQWAGDRLQAAGSTGQAIVLIKDASLTAQPLKINDGIDNWFTRQQGIRYNARAEIAIEANGREGFATADAVATRSITLPENPTAAERQDAYYTLLNELMRDLGQNMEGAMQTHLAPFIITAPFLNNSGVPVSSLMAPGTTQPMMGQPLSLQPITTQPMMPQQAVPQAYTVQTPPPQALPPVTTAPGADTTATLQAAPLSASVVSPIPAPPPQAVSAPLPSINTAPMPMQASSYNPSYGGSAVIPLSNGQ